MASPAEPATPLQPGPQQMPPHILAMLQAEAQKRGMTLEQFQEWQRKTVIEESAKLGITPQEFVNMKRAEAQEHIRQQQLLQEQQAQSQQQGGQQPPQQQGQPGQPQQRMQQLDITKPVEAKPDALAVAKFLRSQNLKTRTVLFNGQRKDMFKVKRAMRALQTPKYTKAQKKDPLLPKIENEDQARNALQLLPLSMLALRVSKKDPHEGHNHATPKKEKRVKGQWDVKIEHQQQFEPLMHYMWVYEGSQWKTKVWAAVALVAVFTVVLFPLWPLMMRQGVWYISVGAMGLLIAFFGLGIVRLILYCLTVFTIPPGLWIFPNLFEDVGFFDSFRPTYQWGDTKKQKKKSKAKAIAAAAGDTAAATPAATEKEAVPVQATQATPTANGTAVTSSAQAAAPTATRRQATVEEDDED